LGLFDRDRPDSAGAEPGAEAIALSSAAPYLGAPLNMDIGVVAGHAGEQEQERHERSHAAAR